MKETIKHYYFNLKRIPYLAFNLLFNHCRAMIQVIAKKKEINKANKLASAIGQLELYDFREVQKKMLFRILKYSKKNVPYYSSILQDVKIDKKQSFSILEQMPLLSKDIIRKEGVDIYSKEIKKLSPYWMNTGGSTGEPLHFPVSNNYEIVHQMALYNIMGWKESELIVSIDGTRVSADSLKKNIFWEDQPYNFPYGGICYSTLYMNDKTIPYYIEHINMVSPSVMRGYPSGFIAIAKYMKNKSISVKWELRGIYLTSEFFDDSCIALLNEYFRCPIYGQYGNSEVSVFAITDADSLIYKCSPLYGFTEVLDEEGNHVNENETGEIVTTSFSNKAMPLIRYKTGDLAVYGGNTNGFTILKSILGRSVDYILDEKHQKFYLVGLVFGGHLSAFNKIKQWQIEQSTPGYIDIRIVKDDLFSNVDEKEIQELFNSVNIKAYFLYLDEIPLTPRGKRKFMIQNVLSRL